MMFLVWYSEIFSLSTTQLIQLLVKMSYTCAPFIMFPSNRSEVFALYSLRASSQMGAKWPAAQYASTCRFSHTRNRIWSSSWGNTHRSLLSWSVSCETNISPTGSHSGVCYCSCFTDPLSSWLMLCSISSWWWVLLIVEDSSLFLLSPGWG